MRTLLVVLLLTGCVAPKGTAELARKQAERLLSRAAVAGLALWTGWSVLKSRRRKDRPT